MQIFPFVLPEFGPEVAFDLKPSLEFAYKLSCVLVILGGVKTQLSLTLHMPFHKFTFINFATCPREFPLSVLFACYKIALIFGAILISLYAWPLRQVLFPVAIVAEFYC